jgi:hypothetical protein
MTKATRIIKVTAECPNCGGMNAHQSVGDPDLLCNGCNHSFRINNGAKQMTKAKIQQAKQIQNQINDVADQILENLGGQCGGDVYVAIAALAVVMCSLARADEMPLVKVTEALEIAHRQVNA